MEARCCNWHPKDAAQELCAHSSHEHLASYSTSVAQWLMLWHHSITFSMHSFSSISSAQSQKNSPIVQALTQQTFQLKKRRNEAQTLVLLGWRIVGCMLQLLSALRATIRVQFGKYCTLFHGQVSNNPLCKGVRPRSLLVTQGYVTLHSISTLSVVQVVVNASKTDPFSKQEDRQQIMHSSHCSSLYGSTPQPGSRSFQA